MPSQVAAPAAAHSALSHTRTPSHRTPHNQVTWAAGVAGGLYLILTKAGGQPLPLYVAEHPWAVWLVGPYFASLTGAPGMLL